MNADELRRRLARSAIVRTVEWLPTTDSTNAAVRRLAARGALAGTVVVADAQTAGRGRLGRRWHSPPGLGAYVSILLRPAEPVRWVTRWTLGAAVALCESCRRHGAGETEIEWPNDLIAGGRKMAGILAEMRSAGDRVELVLGAGINVQHGEADFPDEIAGMATSLTLVTGASFCATESLIADYLEELGRISLSLDRGEWPTLAERWERLAPNGRGARVRVTRADGGTFSGLTAGLGDQGQLLVDPDQGDREEVRMADSAEYLED